MTITRIALVAALTLVYPVLAVADEAVMREVMAFAPGRLDFTYNFSSPVKSVEFDFKMIGASPQSVMVRFGNGRSTEIPAALLQCFRGLRPRDSFLLATKPDQDYPRVEDDWWAALAIPYEKDDALSKSSDASTTPLPYMQFVFSRWQLSYLVIQETPAKTRKIQLPLKDCADQGAKLN